MGLAGSLDWIDTPSLPGSTPGRSMLRIDIENLTKSLLSGILVLRVSVQSLSESVRHTKESADEAVFWWVNCTFLFIPEIWVIFLKAVTVFKRCRMSGFKAGRENNAFLAGVKTGNGAAQIIL